MYAKYKENPDAVDRSWWPILENYKPTETTHATSAAPTAPVPAAPVTASPAPTATPAPVGEAPLVAKTTRVEAKPQPIPAQAPATSAINIITETEEATEDRVDYLKGMGKALATNMDASLEVPTATSVRTIPAKLMIDNRIVINSHLSRTRGGKVSFTHIIGYAIIRA
ncbi:MAG: multifunctional oxoglutarate decarboxylase/oxoglutarate dehydrogenase thiamine pyrophosphate-binding subunit/dihydrolipoyllysine-residue succinyltransferase subunit, partial [Rhodoluna sp.]